MTNEEINKRIAELKGFEWKPQYSDYWAENIGIAWELFEEMTEQNARIMCINGLYIVQYLCGAEAKDKTASIAICLTWIKWKENL